MRVGLFDVEPAPPSIGDLDLVQAGGERAGRYPDRGRPVAAPEDRPGPAQRLMGQSSVEQARQVGQGSFLAGRQPGTAQPAQDRPETVLKDPAGRPGQCVAG